MNGGGKRPSRVRNRKLTGGFRSKTGTINLQNERLRLLGLRVPQVGVIPISLVQEASGLLSSRLINLQVSGTARNPAIRLRPVPLLAEEAVRFFLRRGGVGGSNLIIGGSGVSPHGPGGGGGNRDGFVSAASLALDSTPSLQT